MPGSGMALFELTVDCGAFLRALITACSCFRTVYFQSCSHSLIAPCSDSGFSGEKDLKTALPPLKFSTIGFERQIARETGSCSIRPEEYSFFPNAL